MHSISRGRYFVFFLFTVHVHKMFLVEMRISWPSKDQSKYIYDLFSDSSQVWLVFYCVSAKSSVICTEWNMQFTLIKFVDFLKSLINLLQTTADFQLRMVRLHASHVTKVHGNGEACREAIKYTTTVHHQNYSRDSHYVLICCGFSQGSFVHIRQSYDWLVATETTLKNICK